MWSLLPQQAAKRPPFFFLGAVVGLVVDAAAAGTVCGASAGFSVAVIFSVVAVAGAEVTDSAALTSVSFVGASVAAAIGVSTLFTGVSSTWYPTS